VRIKVFEILQNLRERLAKLEQFLDQTSPSELKKSDILEVLDIARTRNISETDIANFLVTQIKLEIPRPDLSETERNRIRDRIQDKLREHPVGIFRQSPGLKESVAALIEKWIARDMVTHFDTYPDLLRCAIDALRTEKRGRLNEMDVIETYATDASDIIQKLRNEKIESYLEKTIDRAVNMTIDKANLKTTGSQ